MGIFHIVNMENHMSKEQDITLILYIQIQQYPVPQSPIGIEAQDIVLDYQKIMYRVCYNREIKCMTCRQKYGLAS